MLRVMLFVMALGLGLIVHAEEASDFQPGDALYAPEEESGTAESAAVSAPRGASYYSTAKISAVDFGHDSRPIEGAEFFIDGRFVGKSPLDLSGFLINKPAVTLTARLAGYHEAAREAVHIPAEGEARILMVGDNAVSWYTTPSWVTGLLLLGGAVAAYSNGSNGNSSTGIALVSGGVGVIVISQAIARLIHLPGLDKDVAALNAKGDPIP